MSEQVPLFQNITISIYDCPICDHPLVCDLMYIDENNIPVVTKEAVTARFAGEPLLGHEDKRVVVNALYCQKDRLMFRP